MSMADYEDCLTDLFGACWIASQRFNPVDDGRGSNRLAGYLAWKLHKEIIDWKRRRWKSTRYLTTPIIETPYDDELSGATHADDELVGLNAKTFHWRARDAYERTCLPLAESGMDWVKFAFASGQGVNRVRRALQIVREELVLQGVLPSTMPPESPLFVAIAEEARAFMEAA